jgi:integrase
LASIKRRPDGRWRARYRDAAGKEHAAHFTKRSDAQKWLDSAISALDRQDWVDPQRARQTVGVWGRQWLDGRVNLKPKTLHGYESLWATQIKPTWERVPLAAVTNAEVAKWVAKMHEDLSPSRTRQAYGLLSAILSAAVRDRRLPANPAAHVKLPRMPEADNRYLTHEQLERVAKACGPYDSLVLVLGYCGLRWGEAAALRVRSVDLLRGRITVAEAMTEVNGRAFFGTPKTHQRRAVVVPRFLRRELRRACKDKSSDDFVWPAVRGGVLRVGVFRRRYFDKAVGAAKLPFPTFTPHDLRDAAASFAIASGATVKGVQSMLGHKSATQTLDRYASLWPDELDAVAERVDAARRKSRISRTNRGLRAVPS